MTAKVTTNRYRVKAECLTTGATYEWPSISAATKDGGFSYNMIKLCLAGQLESYSGLRFTTDSPRRTTQPSARILEAAELHGKGLTARQMADTMGISLNGVKFLKQRAKHLGLIQLGAKSYHVS
ncbi:hypothetical protein [Aeromonas phage Asp37]|nr:hypothetical protein [Aeromonas phage Asp37]